MRHVIRTLQIGLEWFPEHGGGLDRYFMELIERGDDVGIACQGLVAAAPGVLRDSKGKVSAFAERTDPLFTRLHGVRRAVGNYLADAKPDIVAAHFALHTAPTLDLIKVPLVVHFQGPWYDESRAQGVGSIVAAAKRGVERMVYRRASRCIVLSEAFKTLLVERFAVEEHRVHVSPGAVDTSRFLAIPQTRDAARTLLDWPVDRPIILAVRRLVRRMGLDDLIDAMKEVVRWHPDVLLLVAGRGPERAALQDRIDILGLASNIKLLGFVADSDLPLAYRAANMTITPTTALEGFGLITVEAMASGTPAMVTPVGGLPEIVGPFAPDLVLPGCGSGAIANGLRAWLDGVLKIPDADACRDYADANFSWPVSLERIRTVYDLALHDA